MGAAACLVGIWLQVVEGWPSGMRLVTYSELERQGPMAGAFVAWSHTPDKWETGDFFLRLVYDPAYPSDRTRRLKRWGDSLGLIVSTWSGPEGAALLVEAPWPHKKEALQWLHAAITSLELGDERLYQWAVYRYRRQQEGLRLGQEIARRRRGWRGFPPSYEAVKTYFYTALRPENVWVGVFGRLSLREKADLRRLWAHWNTPVPDSSSSYTTSSSPLPPDTVEENLWAYPIYGAACIRTPTTWPERLAFVEAFLSWWQESAPPLQFRGAFEGPDRYCFDVRLDGKSYQALQRLTYLAVRDSAQMSAWMEAYARRRLKLRGEPVHYPDVWIAALLRGDSVSLPDTVPSLVWLRGWPITLRGIWLVQELYALDTLLEARAIPEKRLAPDTAAGLVPFETLWVPPRRRAEPPLSTWAAAMQANLASQSRLRWVLVGYYRHRREEGAVLRRLHDWRRVLIKQYLIPPGALQVQVRPAPPDVSPNAIRVVCVGFS